jgi:hypothetical protein
VATADPEEQLAWEARQRPRAGVAAILAAVLMLGGDIWATTLFRDAPTAKFLDAFATALRPGPIGNQPSTRTAYFEFVHAHAGGFIPATAVKGVGFLAMAWALTFLIMAVRARRPIRRPLLYLPVIGGVLTALGTVMFAVAYDNAVQGFLSGPHTVDRAYNAASSSSLVTAQIFRDLLGPLILAAGWVVTSLNAMRAGLLTRFMGILGVIIGVLQVVRLGPLPVVQTFWLAALGVLLLGFWPAGLPPAWRTGKEEPWPSQAEVTQRRRAAAEARRGAKGGVAARTAGGDAEAAGPASAVPERAKRKRKRR